MSEPIIEFLAGSAITYLRKSCTEIVLLIDCVDFAMKKEWVENPHMKRDCTETLHCDHSVIDEFGFTTTLCFEGSSRDTSLHSLCDRVSFTNTAS